jgi:hypothetical protein
VTDDKQMSRQARSGQGPYWVAAMLGIGTTASRSVP